MGGEKEKVEEKVIPGDTFFLLPHPLVLRVLLRKADGSFSRLRLPISAPFRLLIPASHLPSRHESRHLHAFPVHFKATSSAFPRRPKRGPSAAIVCGHGRCVLLRLELSFLLLLTARAQDTDRHVLA